MYQYLSIPVLMLMVRDLEFHHTESYMDETEKRAIESAIDEIKAVLVEKS